MTEEARMVIVGATELPRSAATVRDDLRAAAERSGGRQIEAYTVDDERVSVTFWVDVRDDEEALPASQAVA
jgi:hypothetical protein